MSSHIFATFVNSSDGFQDCWNPFFTLFDQFGGVLREHPVYLNTERAQFVWPGLTVHSTQVWEPGVEVRPTWSECLRRGIESIQEPYVLYLQEDYFLQEAVDSTLLQHAVEALEKDRGVGVVYLNRYGPIFTNSERFDDILLRITPPARYLASTQAGIWRKEALLALVREWENGWAFEIFGSRRAARLRYQFLTVRPELLEQRRIIDYVYTGIIKGQWKQECIPLFKRHGIEIELSRRGIYRDGGRFKSRLEVARKLSSNPLALVRSIQDLLRFSERDTER